MMHGILIFTMFCIIISNILRKGAYDMARRRHTRGARPQQSQRRQAPEESAAMAALKEKTSEIDRRDGYRSEGFQPKPRAIRRYEKYAGMGD